MPLRVAFDLDGTLADMRSVLRREAARLFADPGVVVPDVEPAVENGGSSDSAKVLAELPLTDRQRAALWSHVKATENFWTTLKETEPGIVARLAALATARRWDVIFLTTRPSVAGETVQVQTQRWLAAHGFALPSVFVARRSRGAIADALDLHAVVDDRPENCLDVALDSKAQAILIWPGEAHLAPPGMVSTGVRLAPSTSAALDLLVRMDDAKNDGPVVRSIKKLFGKETAV